MGRRPETDKEQKGEPLWARLQPTETRTPLIVLVIIVVRRRQRPTVVFLGDQSP